MTSTARYPVLIRIQKYLKEVLSGITLEYNDGFLRGTTRMKMYNYLMGLKTRREIWRFKVVCDMSNNTIEDIINSKFHIDVSVEPEEGAGFYHIPGSVHCFEKGYIPGGCSAKKRSRKVRR